MSAPRLRLPGTALDVSPICLGGNRFGATLDQDASFALLDAFVEMGGNFIDTAHVYADWIDGIERSASEKTLGRWLRARGLSDSVIIATKGGHPGLGDASSRRLDRASLRRDVEEAADNLGLDCLPIFYLHRDDPARPVADILGSLEEMRRAGLIRHYAASNWSTARLREAGEVARGNDWQGFVASQAEWSLATRNPGSAASDLVAMDPDMIDWHRQSGVAAIPYSAQARGYFEKLAEGRLDAPTAAAYDNPANRAMGDRLVQAAARHGVTPTQAMLAAMTAAPFPVVPVVGCRTQDQLATSFAGLQAGPNDDMAALIWPRTG